MTSLPARELRRFSAVDALVDLLRNAVLDGDLAPGHVITEGEVVTAYGVSRPTAKAAIRALVSERILHQDPNKSAAVAEPGVEDVIDLFRIRIPIELEILREIIVNRAREDLTFQLSKDAHAAVEDMWTIDDQDVKPHEFVAADLRFHKALAESAGSLRLLRSFEELEGEMHLSMLQSFTFLDRPSIGAQHGEILERVEAAVADRSGDWEPAKRAMQEHLTSACQIIAAGLSQQHRG